MQLLESSSAELTPEFGLMAGRWSQYVGLGGIPFGAMWCVVPAGARSHTDCHPERELVVVVRGSARVRASGGEELAMAGSAVMLNSGEEHVLVNTSGQDPLVVLSIYWLPEGGDGQAAGAQEEAGGGG